MALFTSLRALVYLRQIARGVERIAIALEAKPRVKARPSEFGLLDVKAANAAWHRARVAAGFAEDDDASPE